MKKLFIFFLVASLLLVGCGQQGGNQPAVEKTKQATIEFTDDTGKLVKLAKPAKKIISLYSAHTENLFSLGLDAEIIGVSTSENYPPAALQKTKFDYRADPERVIAQEPDVVLIRPFVKRGYPDFVKALENAGIQVISLYPEKYADFPEYIQKLGLLTGKTVKAQELLTNFEQQLAKLTQANTQKQAKVFFEATSNQRTTTPDSIPAGLITKLGYQPVFIGKPVVDKGTSIASFDLEELMLQADKIDIYIAQKGIMNAKVNKAVIIARPGYENIKAVRTGKVLIMDEKLISSPTFRLLLGAEQLINMQ